MHVFYLIVRILVGQQFKIPDFIAKYFNNHNNVINVTLAQNQMTHLVDGDGQQVSERKRGKQINTIPQMFVHVIHFMCFIKNIGKGFQGNPMSRPHPPHHDT